MKSLNSLSLKIEGKSIFVLDQSLLPHQESWIECRTINDMCSCILNLNIRGAPLIGIGAAFSLAQLAEQGCTYDEFQKACQKLRSARPTAVNLMHAIDQFLVLKDIRPELVVKIAEDIFKFDIELCDRIAKNGSELIKDGDRILTHCNAGALATAGVGTAIGVLTEAHKRGKKIHVYVDETRPLLQGARLTAYELEKAGVPFTLICDNMASWLMREGKINKAIVGADRIAVNGDFANKIGTLSAAISCAYFKLDFYVAAPQTTVDPLCASGDKIEIEERNPLEVLGVAVGTHKHSWAPLKSQVRNPAFDVTPAELVTNWILDSGVYSRADIKSGLLAKGHSREY